MTNINSKFVIGGSILIVLLMMFSAVPVMAEDSTDLSVNGTTALYVGEKLTGDKWVWDTNTLAIEDGASMENVVIRNNTGITTSVTVNILGEFHLIGYFFVLSNAIDITFTGGGSIESDQAYIASSSGNLTFDGVSLILKSSEHEYATLKSKTNIVIKNCPKVNLTGEVESKDVILSTDGSVEIINSNVSLKNDISKNLIQTNGGVTLTDCELKDKESLEFDTPGWEPGSTKTISGKSVPSTLSVSVPGSGFEITLEPMNGGDPIVLLTDENGKIKDKIPTIERTGYVFDGWFTAAIGGDSINLSTEIFKGDTKLYAHWSPNIVVIDFDANGGSGEMAQQTITYGVGNMKLTTNTFVKEGYKFDGWSTGTGDTYTDGQSMKDYLESNIGQTTLSLKAQWSGGPTPLSPELEPFDKEIEKGRDLVLTIKNAEGINELHIYRGGKEIQLKEGDYKIEVKNGETSVVKITIYSKVMTEAGEYSFEVKVGDEILKGDFTVSSPPSPSSGYDFVPVSIVFVIVTAFIAMIAAIMRLNS